MIEPAELEADVDYAPSCDQLLDMLFREYTDEQIADGHGGWIRKRWPEIPPGREALLAWLAQSRQGTDYEDGPLSLEQRADELNHCESLMGGDTLWVVVAGRIVSEGGALHRELVERQRRENMLMFRLRLAAISRPLIRVRTRGRSRRGRRATSRRSRAFPRNTH